MSFCSNCGVKLNDGVKFCSSCGASVQGESDSPKPSQPSNEDKVGKAANTLFSSIKSVADNAKQVFSDGTLTSTDQATNVFVGLLKKKEDTDPSLRRQEYAGSVLKCPHCGASVTHTTAICPECGNYLTGQTAADSVKDFNEQLMAIESKRKKPGFGSALGLTVDVADQQKLSLIRSFPIPNSVDDIAEFMVLAIANIDVGLSKKTMMNKYQGSIKGSESSLTIPTTISNAWVSKMQQAYQKAEMSFPNDPKFLKLTEMYLSKMKELKIKVD